MLLDTYWTEQYYPHTARLRACTRVGYESAYRRHISPTLGNIHIDQISTQDVDAWLAQISTVGAARKAWAVLRSMLRTAIRWGIITNDITRQVTVPKRVAYNPSTLNADQIRDLLQGFYGAELEAWLICSVCLGLRTEEALGLEWSDINLKNGHVHIIRGLQWVAGKEIIVEPKTELSKRTVVLPRFAILRLRQIRGTGRIIGDLNPNQVDRRYRTYCKQHNLPCVPRRNLRHSWATTALAAGVDVAVVSRALGHSSIETTARYYLRPDLDVLRQAATTWAATIVR